jgi:hypothetical protein
VRGALASDCLLSSLICDDEATMKSKSKLPTLQTVKIGRGTRVVYDDILLAAGRDPANEPSDRPKAVSIRKAQALLDVSRATVNRMIVAGREEAAA